MNNKYENEQAEDSQSCNLTRKQGHDLVVKGAKIIRESSEGLALLRKEVSQGWLKFFFYSMSGFRLCDKDDWKYL